MKLQTLAHAMLFAAPIVAGAEFRNLGFEEADVRFAFIRDGTGIPADTATALIPGWTFMRNNTSGSFEPLWIYLQFPLNLELWGIHTNTPWTGPTEGRYGFVANPNSAGFGGFETHSLMQTGGIPVETLSLRFDIFGDPWDVYLNGKQLPLIGYDTPLVHGESREILGDISAFAGQEVELKFVTRSVSFGYNGLDSLRFSPEAGPEPGPAALLLAGGLAWGAPRGHRAGQRGGGGRSSHGRMTPRQRS